MWDRCQLFDSFVTGKPAQQLVERSVLINSTFINSDASIRLVNALQQNGINGTIH